ncbi:MAG: hypothetical protein IJC32_05810 [Clostridia bacterium]|nr:hypothetical protein [Clostridia bacterium]
MKKMVCVLLLLSMCACLFACGGDTTDKAEQFEWTDIEMHEVLPKPESTYGKVSHNSKTALTFTICDIDEKAFKKYRDECIDKGYTIDAEESGMSYSAFNEDGYSVRLSFFDYNQEMSIYLDAPEEMDEFEWPTHGLAVMLPTTKSTLGDISWDNSETFIVHVGNMSIDDYKDYVKACEDKGFTIDYSKDDEYYSAKDAKGYKLTLRYLGFNKIEIAIKAPEGSTTTPDTTEKIPDTTEKIPDNDDIDPDFKEAMDSYEKFMNEYVAFMKKFQNNPSDLGLLADYAKYMSDYADVVKAFEKWEDEDLNNTELAYYIDVQSRVSKKLLEVAN